MMRDIEIDFGTFTNQFILCKREQYIPAGWDKKGLREWLLGYHPSLPLIPIQGPESSHVGWLLGHPIDEDSRILKQLVVYNGKLESNWFVFEEWLYRLGGAFAAILITRHTSRIYLDANGMLPLVYHPESETVASTPTLIGTAEYHEPLMKMIGIPERDGWYPFGLTPKKRVERLVPNHFLDLITWNSFRHWPSKSIAINQDAKSAIKEVARVVRRTIEAVTNEYPTYMSLTAGGDTRVMLACGKGLLDNITFYTSRIPDEHGMLDCAIGSEIAQRFNLKHQVLQAKRVTKQQHEDWLYRTGHCSAGRVLTYSAGNYQLNPQCPLLIGKPGSIGEAPFYRRFGATPDTIISSEEIVRFIHMPEIQEIVDRADAWLRELSAYDVLTVFSLLQLEQFQGCGSALQRYGNNWNAFQLFPLNHRRISDLVLSLPQRYQTKARFRSDIIKSQWPELLEFPINNYMGLRGLKKTIRREIGKFKFVKRTRDFFSSFWS